MEAGGAAPHLERSVGMHGTAPRHVEAALEPLISERSDVSQASCGVIGWRIPEGGGDWAGRNVLQAPQHARSRVVERDVRPPIPMWRRFRCMVVILASLLTYGAKLSLLLPVRRLPRLERSGAKRFGVRCCHSGSGARAQLELWQRVPSLSVGGDDRVGSLSPVG